MDVLLNLDPSGKPPASRLASATDAYTIYRTFLTADYNASIDRARVQSVLDGDPPIPPHELKALGQSYRANLNWGEGLADLESALAAYDDLITGVDCIVSCRTSYGDQAQQQDWNSIISEEYHNLLLDWEEFHFKHQLLSQYFVKEGLGVLFWEDERNWQFDVSSIGEFLVPKDTKACGSLVEIAVRKRNYQAGQLYKFIENESAASQRGWNVEAVKNVLKHAQSQVAKESDWEELQKAFKNKDIYYSFSKIPPVRTLHYYVREFNGTYSHHIGLRDQQVQDFLFSSVGRFGKANEAFIVFPFGIGTNGDFASIRGMSHKNFPYLQSTNRLRNASLDGALLRATLLLKGSTESDRQQLAMAYAGPLALIPPGTEAVNVQMPNIANEVLPVIREMQILRKENNGGYLSHTLSPEGGDRTAYEVQAQIAQSNVLTSSSLNLFYEPWGRMLQETFRRLKRENWMANEPGAQLAMRFRKRLSMRGVPWEAVQMVESVTPVRAVGYGSPAARIAAFGRVMQIFPQLDPIGQKNLVRDIVTQNVGPSMADRYAPRAETRMGTAAKIAELENDSMQSGRSVTVLPDEDHFVHAMVHCADIQKFLTALQQNQIHPFIALKYFTLQAMHTGQHLQKLSDNDMRAQTIGQMKKIYGAMQAALQGLMKQAQQGQITDPSAAPVQPDNANPNPDGGDQQGQPQQPQVDPKTLIDVQRGKMELQHMQEKHDLEMQIRSQEAKQKLAITDAESASKIGQEKPVASQPLPALSSVVASNTQAK